MEYSLSEDDIRSLVPNVRIFSYSELKNMNNSTQLVNNKYPNAAVLYLTGPNYGHWIGVKKYKNTIQFFDPYGEFIDSQQNKIEKIAGKGFLKRSGQVRNKMRSLLGNSKEDIHYSEYKLQKLKPGINTCGRWVSSFLSSPFNVDQYATFIKRTSKMMNNIPYDELIVKLTS